MVKVNSEMSRLGLVRFTAVLCAICMLVLSASVGASVIPQRQQQGRFAAAAPPQQSTAVSRSAPHDFYASKANVNPVGSKQQEVFQVPADGQIHPVQPYNVVHSIVERMFRKAAAILAAPSEPSFTPEMAYVHASSPRRSRSWQARRYSRPAYRPRSPIVDLGNDEFSATVSSSKRSQPLSKPSWAPSSLARSLVRRALVGPEPRAVIESSRGVNDDGESKDGASASEEDGVATIFKGDGTGEHSDSRVYKHASSGSNSKMGKKHSSTASHAPSSKKSKPSKSANASSSHSLSKSKGMSASKSQSKSKSAKPTKSTHAPQINLQKQAVSFTVNLPKPSKARQALANIGTWTPSAPAGSVVIHGVTMKATPTPSASESSSSSAKGNQLIASKKVKSSTTASDEASVTAAPVLKVHTKALDGALDQLTESTGEISYSKLPKAATLDHGHVDVTSSDTDSSSSHLASASHSASVEKSTSHAPSSKAAAATAQSAKLVQNSAAAGDGFPVAINRRAPLETVTHLNAGGMMLLPVKTQADSQATPAAAAQDAEVETDPNANRYAALGSVTAAAPVATKAPHTFAKKVSSTKKKKKTSSSSTKKKSSSSSVRQVSSSVTPSSSSVVLPSPSSSSAPAVTSQPLPSSTSSASSSVQTVSTIVVTSNDPTYGPTEVRADLEKIMAWAYDTGNLTPAQMNETVAALLSAAARYYPELGTKTVVRTILADIKAESDFHANAISGGRLDSGSSWGLLQVSPGAGSQELPLWKDHGRTNRNSFSWTVQPGYGGPLYDWATGLPMNKTTLVENDLFRPWVNIHMGVWTQANNARTASQDPWLWEGISKAAAAARKAEQAYAAAQSNSSISSTTLSSLQTAMTTAQAKETSLLVGPGLPRSILTGFGSWVAGSASNGDGSYTSAGDDISAPYFQNILQGVNVLWDVKNLTTSYLDSLIVNAGVVDYVQDTTAASS